MWGPGPDGVSPLDVLRTFVVSSAAAHPAAFAPVLADRLPYVEGPRTYAGQTSVPSAH